MGGWVRPTCWPPNLTPLPQMHVSRIVLELHVDLVREVLDGVAPPDDEGLLVVGLLALGHHVDVYEVQMPEYLVLERIQVNGRLVAMG